MEDEEVKEVVQQQQVRMSTRGVELLSSLFLSKKKIWLFDIPSVYFKQRCQNKTFPQIDKHDCIYGEFLFDDCVRNFIESYYNENDKFEESAMDFRKKCIREIIFDINPDRLASDSNDYITPQDISTFMQTIAKNRIWDDSVVKGQTPVLTAYMAGATVAWNSDIELKLIQKDEEALMRLESEGLETLEKEAWKKVIAEPYIPYITGLNLELLKNILRDNLWNSFEPQWRQTEFLYSMKRFNFLAASRRSGKCQSPDSPIRLYDWTFKRAWDIEEWDVLLASNKMSANIVRWKTVYNKKLYNVTLDNWMSIKVTNDHRFPTQKNYKNWIWDMDILDYKQVSELSNKDFIPLNMWFESDNMKYATVSEIDIEEAKLFGYFLWDWCHANNTIAVHNDNIADKLWKICAKLWKDFSYRKEQHVFSIKDWLEFKKKYKELSELANNKYIPNYVFWWSKKQKRALLQGYIETDWCILARNDCRSKTDSFFRKANVQIEMSSVSEKLIDWIMILLYDLWIVWIKRHYKKKTNFTKWKYIDVYFCLINKMLDIKSVFTHCDVSAKWNFEKALDILNNSKFDFTNERISVIPVDAYKYRSNESKRISEDKDNHACSFGDWKVIVTKPVWSFQRWKANIYGLENWLEYSWHRVKSVECIWESEVIDIEVWWDHLYWVWSILSHNTFLGSYLAARQFYIPNQVIIYVVPTLRWHAKVPWRYLFAMLKNDPNVSFNRADWTITNRKNGSEIIFFSGERENSIRWQAANLLIFDEAAFLSEELYVTAEPLIRTTNGIVYCISTVNPQTPKNWFYYKLVEAEITKYDLNTNKYWKRITLRENPFIPEAEKHSIAEDGKHNIKLFQAEWMAEFQDGDSFDFSKFRIIDYQPVEVMVWGIRKFFLKDEALDKVMNTYQHFIICHDSAKLKDKPWVGVIWVKFKQNAKWERVQQWCDIVGSWYMSWFEYMDQVKLIVKLKEILGKDKVSTVIEYNHWWVTVEELFRREYNEYVVPIQTIWWTTFVREDRIRRVGKDFLLGKMASAIDRGVLRGFSFMEQLRIEIETFDVNETQQSRKAWHHFDIMSALLCGIMYADQMWFLEEYKDTDRDVLDERRLDSFGDLQWMRHLYEQKNQWQSRFDRGWY